MNLPYLTDIEIDEICSPLKSKAAQRRYLAETLGLLVRKKPNGRALVARSEFERAMVARPAGDGSGDSTSQPNRNAYLRHIGKEKRHGT